MNAVVGATGILGGMIVQRLLERGQDVRILVRENSPSEELAQQGRATPARSLIDAGAEPVYGDLKVPGSLDAVVAGVQTVVTTANSAMRGGDDNPQTVDLEGNRNLIEAARTAGVERFVFVSALGVDPNHPEPFLRAKGQTEVALRENGMGYTILAPTVFMDIWVTAVVGMPVLQGRPVTLVGEGRRRHSFVAIRDVAAFAVATVGHADARDRHLAIGGPEPLSWRDVVATYERVLGRSIAVELVAPGDPVPGLPDPMPALLAGMETYDSVVEMDELARTFGMTLTNVETFVREQLGAGATQAK